MQMRKHNKILACFFLVFFLSSLTVRSEVAPNLLELTEGICSKGEIYQDELWATLNFSIDRIWHDPFFDEDIVEITRDVDHKPPYDPIVNVSKEIVTSLIINDNRSAFMPVVSHYVKSWDDTILVFINYTDSLDFAEEDLLVTYNGITYTYSEMDPGHELYGNISFWVMSWGFGNMFEQQIMPITKYAISPQATIGQEIDYGQYTGEVMGFTTYDISETEYYEVIEVYHDEVVVIINMFGTDEPYTIGECTLLYEKRTGLVLHWIEYNATLDEYYFYNATEVVGISPLVYVPEYSVPFIAVISSILIAIPILIGRRKKE